PAQEWPAPAQLPCPLQALMPSQITWSPPALSSALALTAPDRNSIAAALAMSKPFVFIGPPLGCAGAWTSGRRRRFQLTAARAAGRAGVSAREQQLARPERCRFTACAVLHADLAGSDHAQRVAPDLLARGEREPAHAARAAPPALLVEPAQGLDRAEEVEPFALLVRLGRGAHAGRVVNGDERADGERDLQAGALRRIPEAGPDLLVAGRVVREVGDPVAQGVERRAVAEVDRAPVRRGVAPHPRRVPDGGQQDAPPP